VIYKNKKILAIIPARSGSTRLLNKNMKNFCGKPLVYWTIKASKNSKFIDKTLVSSNSSKILNFAKKNKVDFLIKRPKNLSNKFADSWDVVRHTIKHLILKKKINFSYIIMLQPTSPLRNSHHIDECLKKLKPSDTGIVSISKTFKPLEWVANLNKNKSFKSFEKGIKIYKKNKNKKNSYIINGAIYVFKTAEIFKKNFMFKKTVKTFEMDINVSIDIDTKLEFKIAELLKTNHKYY
jgi:CMP-N-acetylneuraminic acid synthetase